MLGILIVIVVIFVLYLLYGKDYFAVEKIFHTLEKTLDTRDLLIMKLIPEIKSEEKKANIIKLIEERMKNKKISYTEKMKLEISLNQALKDFYEELSLNRKDMMIQATLANAMELEKTLKKLRREYNRVVEKYNKNLVMHKFVCMRIIHMKPLDTYKIVSK